MPLHLSLCWPLMLSFFSNFRSRDIIGDQLRSTFGPDGTSKTKTMSCWFHSTISQHPAILFSQKLRQTNVFGKTDARVA